MSPEIGEGFRLHLRRSRFTEEQIAFALKQTETGTPILEVCHKLGVSEQTFYRCKKQYAGSGCWRSSA
jgi:putative transposase